MTAPATGRRALLGAAALAPLAALPAMAAMGGPGADPVVTLYRQWAAIEAESAAIRRRSHDMRITLLQRWGDPACGPYVKGLWSHDPLYAERRALNERDELLTLKGCELVDAMVSTPATSLAGALAKLRVALEMQWPYFESDPDTEWTEDVAFACVQDAERFLTSVGGAA